MCRYSTLIRMTALIALLFLISACGKAAPAGERSDAPAASPTAPAGSPTATATFVPSATATLGPSTTPAPSATVTPDVLPTLETVSVPTPANPTPSPVPGNGRPILGVTDPQMTCDTRQSITGNGFEPQTTVVILSRLPGSSDVYQAGTTSVLGDGSFRVIVPAVMLMPWCDSASGMPPPENLTEMDIEVWTTSDAAGNPLPARDPHFAYRITFAQLADSGITAQEAMNRVSAYLGGDPEHAGEGFTTTLLNIDEDGMRDGRRYLVTVGTDASQPRDEYVVDATTSQIIGIYYPRATSQYAQRAGREIPEEEAYARAEQWARETFEGFDQLEHVPGVAQGDVAGMIGSPEGDRTYTADWRLRDPLSGGWLPTGVIVRIDLDTDQELSYEAVLVGQTGPTLVLSTEQADCQTVVSISGLGFLPGTTVLLYGWPQGGNRVDLATDPLVVGADGIFMATLDLNRFTGCGLSRGAGFYGKRFGLTAVTVRNAADPRNSASDPAASTMFSLLDPGTGATPDSQP